MKTKDIRPGFGLGDVLFGQSTEEVERLLGPAPESSFEREGDGSTRTLVYPANGIHLFFHEEDDFRLGSIEISLTADVYYLFGVPLVEIDKESLMGLLNRHLSPAEMERVKAEIFEAIEQSLLSVPALKAEFYCGQDGVLEEIHWGPFFGPDDKVIGPGEP